MRLISPIAYVLPDGLAIHYHLTLTGKIISATGFPCQVQRHPPPTPAAEVCFR